MKIVIDINLSPTWTKHLALRGFDAVHWSDVGDPRAEDSVIVAWARAHDAIVFTHDLDFSRILALTHAAGPSVFQVRTSDVLPSSIGDIVVRALRQHADLLTAGAIMVLDASSLRARVLPLSLSIRLARRAWETHHPLAKASYLTDSTAPSPIPLLERLSICLRRDDRL